MIQSIGRVNGLGQVSWSDQTTNRLAASGIGVGFGFGVGILLTLLFPSTRSTYGQSLALAAVGTAITVASSVAPVEGLFFDKLSLVGGVLTGRQLAHAVNSRPMKLVPARC